MHSDVDKNVLEFGFTPGQRVADLGSGAGHYTHALSKVLGFDGRVVAIDVEKERLVRLKNALMKSGRENVDVIWGDIEVDHGTHLQDNFFDGAVFSNILFQLPDVEAAVKEAKRIVKPGGKICVVEWNSLAFLGLAAGKSADKARQALSQDQAEKVFSSAGLTLDRQFHAGEHHYGLIWRKPLQ